MQPPDRAKSGASSGRGEFENEPVLDFSRREHRSKMEEAIRRVRSLLGVEYSLLIGGDKVKAPAQFRSLNPSRRDEVIGVFHTSTGEMAGQAVEDASAAFDRWRGVPADERARILFRAADAVRERRFDLDAWMVLEVGKSWIEADAETAAAIDFLEFHGRKALSRTGSRPMTPGPDEMNTLVHLPVGVTCVITPFSSPIAMLTGMTSAALVTGNPVVLKPSSNAPASGRQVVSCLTEAGLPPGVLNFVTGPGAVVGEAMVGHPETRAVAFAGSKYVGLRVIERAASPSPGQRWIKRVTAGLGAKNAIIVDSEADLDAATTGIVASAFASQGQSASACSRAIIDARVHDEMIERILARVRALRVGNPEDPDVSVGPVIDAEAFRSVMGYIEAGKRAARLICGGEGTDREGYFIQPTVISDVDRSTVIAREEIFGPVLSIIKARDLADAIDLANDGDYGLTGSVYSRNEEKLARAHRELQVGNLYLNRKCAGLRVGRRPFGGFKLSGTDPGIGGPDYLSFFLRAACTSRTLG